MKPVPQATSSVRAGGSAAIHSSSSVTRVVPAGPVPLDVEAAAEPPVVVLARASFVVRLHEPP